MTSSIGKYASSYEEAVFKGHPDKVVRSDVRPADYISSSRLGSFWATRAEELLILLFLALVIGYCTGFYVVGWTALLPVRLVMSYGWDLLLASAMLLRLHGRLFAPRLPGKKAVAAMPAAEQEEAKARRKAAARAYSSRRNGALLACALAAAARWHYGGGTSAPTWARLPDGVRASWRVRGHAWEPLPGSERSALKGPPLSSRRSVSAAALPPRP
eukprot:CAMPEP_0196688656 /NCGR_PEP_ID=MMETSP1090-20130531/17237_1 /TAXON_ID=37098 /ORGANISM="Isochrysis sp, Strain CCMP1244" /LENGTH=214 /DNA_ID=CAMNT_0042027599 /DNA_START=113 /DNA_END=758 /DNA_ORIENTATION=+